MTECRNRLRDSYSGAGGQAQGGSVNGGSGLINIGSGW
jgi:hypothetical protein